MACKETRQLKDTLEKKFNKVEEEKYELLRVYQEARREVLGFDEIRKVGEPSLLPLRILISDTLLRSKDTCRPVGTEERVADITGYRHERKIHRQIWEQHLHIVQPRRDVVDLLTPRIDEAIPHGRGHSGPTIVGRTTSDPEQDLVDPKTTRCE